MLIHTSHHQSDQEMRVAIMTLAHDLSLDADPTVAAEGRLLKHVAEPFLNWWAAERARNTKAPATIMAMSSVFGNLAAALAGNNLALGAGPNGETALANHITETFYGALAEGLPRYAKPKEVTPHDNQDPH